MEVLFAISDYSLLPINAPPTWLWQTWTIRFHQLNHWKQSHCTVPFSFHFSTAGGKWRIFDHAQFTRMVLFQACKCICPSFSQRVSPACPLEPFWWTAIAWTHSHIHWIVLLLLPHQSTENPPASGHIEAWAVERSSTLSFRCPAWKWLFQIFSKWSFLSFELVYYMNVLSKILSLFTHIVSCHGIMLYLNVWYVILLYWIWCWVDSYSLFNCVNSVHEIIRTLAVHAS